MFRAMTELPSKVLEGVFGEANSSLEMQCAVVQDSLTMYQRSPNLLVSLLLKSFVIFSMSLLILGPLAR